MNRLRFLALALVVGLVMAFPAAALGQPLQDHQSRPMVTIDGANAPDDTVVTALIDGAVVATATTTDGIAFIKIPGTGATVGKEISFRVGDVMAVEVDIWARGGHDDKNFEIAITNYVPQPPPVPPHISRLLVSIDGLPAPDGTVVTAWMDGALAATALTANGAAYMRIEGDGSDSGKAISFTIGVLVGGVPGGLMEDLAAAEVDFWEQGGHLDKNFVISAYTAPRTPAEAFAPLIDHLVDGRPNLLGVFWFNDETQSYLSYDPDPDFAFFNDLETVESQQVFWVRLRAPQHFLGRTRHAGWSLAVLP